MRTTIMERKHAMEIKYLPPTNFRPSRFKITSDRFKQSLTFSFNYTVGSLCEMAAIELANRGFTFNTCAETRDGCIILVNEFKGLE